VHAPRDRALADLLDHGHLAVRQALQRHEDHRGAHVDRQRVERAEQARVALPQLGLAAGVAAGVDRDGELEPWVVEHDVLAAARPVPADVERPVDRHPVDPGEELAAALELGQRAVRLQEHVLSDVIGLARRPRDVQREGEDPLAVAGHQRLERAGVACLGGGHQGRRGGGFALGVRHRNLDA
jgi:hypothetical protein